MRINKLFLALVLVLIGGSANAEWVPVNSKVPGPVEIKIVKSDAESTIVEYRVAGFQRDAISIEGKEFAALTIPGLSPIEDKGLPELPRLGKDFMIPEGATASFSMQVLEKQVYNVGEVVPSKGSLTRDVNPADVPYTFASIYTNRPAQFPKSVVQMGAPFKLRDVQGVNVKFFPLQYNAQSKEVTVFSRVQVEIQTTGGKISAFAARKGAGLDDSFLKIYQEHFSNFAHQVEPGILDVTHWVPDSGKVLFVTPARFVESIRPLVNWKLQKGLDAKVATLNETGNTWQTIKGYIQNEYNKNKISYVVLIGDAPEMPFHPGTAGNVYNREADPMYGLVDGNDGYPDLFVSRISIAQPAELEYIVKKTIDYEKNPDRDGDWYNRATGIASNEGNPTDKWRVEELRKMLEGYHYVGTDQVYDPGANSTQVLNALNQGRSFINYTGHGSQYSWVTSGFGNTHIEQLQNGNKLPAIVSVACVNGQFGTGSDSFAERWLKAGSKENPKGAIAIFASSTNQSWVPPTVGQKEITNLIVKEKFNTIGALFIHGSIAVIEDNSSTAAQTFQSWHIFGDATVQLRTQKPTAINVKYPEVVTKGATEIVLDVGEAGILAGVLKDGVQVGSGISGKNGRLVIKLKEGVEGGDKLRVTLTGFDKIPAYIEGLQIASN